MGALPNHSPNLTMQIWQCSNLHTNQLNYLYCISTQKDMTDVLNLAKCQIDMYPCCIKNWTHTNSHCYVCTFMTGLAG